MDSRREAPCGSDWNTQAGTMAWPSCSFRAIITAQGQGSPVPSVLSLGNNAVAKVLASAARVLWVPWRKHHRALWGRSRLAWDSTTNLNPFGSFVHTGWAPCRLLPG